MDPNQLQPGYRLDRYELLCPLAYGGMASVWLARFGGRLGFERMVVIKMILPQYSQDPRFQQMFLDEARIASKIEHSNVARILDVGEHDDNYFIVMEWVDGDSLSKILRGAEQRKQRVPPGVALRICADAAAGLHAAHELKERDGTHLGVVHRDVSPQNILVANSGATMIIDFGVAKARDRVSQDTSAGQLKGKIRYMAPEQALGHSVDARADVWAIGAMLYEMFTGQPPYDGPNEVATLHKLTSGQRPPSIPRSVPEVLRAVVERALAYDPEHRFKTALELNLALEGAMVEINQATTVAIVAHYTGELLADRKAARKRAVDIALDAARQRESLESGVPSDRTATNVLPRPPGNPPENAPPYTETPSEPSLASGPSGGPMSLSELRSASAMEILPTGVPDAATRRKRYIAAAALGVSFAAGVIGVILILGSGKPEVRKAGATTESAALGQSAPPAPATTALDPPADPAPGLPTTATPFTPTTQPATSTTSVAHVEPPPRTTPTVVTHKPPPSFPPTPKPKPTSAPAPTRPDRGF